MDPPILGPLLLQFVLISLNALFACAELAMISMNDNKLSRMAYEGDPRAIRLQKLTAQPARFLATIQVAITLSGFLGSAFAAQNFSVHVVRLLSKLGIGIPAATLNTVSVLLITLLLSYLTLVFGELVPKRVGMHHAESIALALSGLIGALSKVFAPIVWLLTASTNAVLRLLRIDPDKEHEDVTEEEIRMLIDVGSEKGTIRQAERELIQNVFEFNDITADEIETHRTEVHALWLDDPAEVWEETIHNRRHSYYPVADGTIDRVVGILHAKDYFRLADKSKDSVLENAVRPALVVPAAARGDQLFRNMKKARTHFAVVLDEFGGMSGIVTMNDLLEQIVGDFDEEDDVSDAQLIMQEVEKGVWQITGATPLDQVAKTLDISLPDDYETMGGLIFGTLGEIPPDGDTAELTTEGLWIHVLEIREHKIQKALIRKLGPQEDPPISD